MELITASTATTFTRILCSYMHRWLQNDVLLNTQVFGDVYSKFMRWLSLSTR
jgi:hypothetical protein